MVKEICIHARFKGGRKKAVSIRKKKYIGEKVDTKRNTKTSF